MDWLRFRQGIYSATAVILLATLLGKGLGLIREMLIARYYGASAVTDAFYVALAVPALIATALGSSLGTAVIPMSSEIEAREGLDAVRRYHTALFHGTVLVCLIVSAGLYFLAGPLIRIIAPDLQISTTASAVEGLKILSLWTSAGILYYTLTGIFQSQRIFVPPALGQLVETIGIIAALVVTAGSSAATTLPMSWLVGTGSMVALFVLFFCIAIRYRPMPLGSRHMGRTASLTLPLLIATILWYLPQTIDRMFASTLPPGSIAALAYGYTLITIPMYLLILPGSTAALPFLSEMAVAGNWSGIHKLLEKFTRLSFAAFFPIVAFTYAYAGSIVRLVYERGAFDANASAATEIAVQGFAVTILPLASMTILSRVFYALKDARSVVVCLAVGIGVKIGLSYALVEPLSLFGIALATAAAALTSWSLMILLLHRKIGAPERDTLWGPLLGSIGATAISLGALQFLEHLGVRLSVLWSGLLYMAACLLLYLALVPGDRQRFRQGVSALLKGRRDDEPASKL